jgi:phosphoribosylformylglycinamidine cyclo-ligase
MRSSGLHTNGYSLARKIVDERLNLEPNDPFPGTNLSVSETLLSVHRSYFHCVEPVLRDVHALAHITGGGIPGNLDRVLPDSLDAVVDTSSWTVPGVFRVLAEAGGVSEEEMFRTFNMGVGMVAVVPPEIANATKDSLAAGGCEPWVLGTVVRGSGRVVLA